jgi:hypothetical protein
MQLELGHSFEVWSVKHIAMGSKLSKDETYRTKLSVL